MSTQSMPVGGTIDFREYLATLRLRKWSILVIAALCLGLALAYTAQQTPMYTSNAKVQVTNPLAAFQPGNALANPNMQTEQALATSSLVSKCAVLLLQNPSVTDPSEATGTPGDKDYKPPLCELDKLDAVPVPAGLVKSVSANAGQTSTILEIPATDPKRLTAQRLAQSFARAYVGVRTLQAEEYVNRGRQPIQGQIAKLQPQLQQLYARIQSVLNAGQQATQLSA